MSQDFVIKLLRQINGSMPSDNKMLPEKISSLTFAQIYLLAELYKMTEKGHAVISLSKLADKSGFSKSTVCAMLKCLRMLGYIQMQTDRADNRRKAIVLTQRAQAAKADVKQCVCEFNNTLCAGIPEEELHKLEDLLQIILKNVKRTRERDFN